jgi:hypothetical protein
VEVPAVTEAQAFAHQSYRTKNPQALKNIAESLLPALLKSHRKAWITRQFFCD